MRGRLLLVATRSLSAYCAEVAAALGPLHPDDEDLHGSLSVASFADGEMEVELGTSVRGRDVFLFAGSARNSLGLPSAECKLETYHAVDALRRAQAGRISLFEPYCGPGRSDRPTRRNSVGLWMHLKTLVELGVDHYLTFQLHSEKSRTFIDPVRCAVDDLPAHTLLKAHLCDTAIGTVERLEADVRRRWVFCSVDAGGENLAKRFAASFAARIVVAHKQRDYSSPDTVESINLLASAPIEGTVVWVIDDMISTAGSVTPLVRELAARGPAEINVAAVHPVFAPTALDRLGELCSLGLLKSILVTDTVPCTEEIRRRLPCLRVVPTVGYTAEVVHRLNAERPLSSLLGPFDARDYLARRSEHSRPGVAPSTRDRGSLRALATQ
jgi:ribose-phosphate pyrophosphokinase